MAKNNIEKYANEQGLDPERAGAVILAAIDSSSETGSSMGEKELVNTTGLTEGDSKEDAIQKIRTALEKMTMGIKEKGKVAPDEDIGVEEAMRDDLRALLEWVEQ